jgi:hypothetical protein
VRPQWANPNSPECPLLSGRHPICHSLGHRMFPWHPWDVAFLKKATHDCRLVILSQLQREDARMPLALLHEEWDAPSKHGRHQVVSALSGRAYCSSVLQVAKYSEEALEEERGDLAKSLERLGSVQDKLEMDQHEQMGGQKTLAKQ